MNPLLFTTMLISFLATFSIIPFWIKKAKQIGLVWTDMNKYKKKDKVPGSGGIAVVVGTVIGIFIYIALGTFYFKFIDNTVEILAIISSLFLITGVGLIDDLFGWRKGGLSRRSRIVLVLFSSVPLIVINAGESTMLGINLGIFYPLVFVPLGFLGASTTFNFLAGFNGLEASQGILLLGGLTVVTYLTGNAWLSLIALCMVASLIAFYIFNKYPAKVFPGDVMTYAVGAMIAIIAIMGNIEKIAIFFFIPYFLEIILKIRGKLNIHNFGVPNKEGGLDLRYEKIYSLTHLSLKILKKFKKNVKEREVVLLINAFQIWVMLIGLLIFL
ncbi:MAG: glycosyl transferase family 4 [Nanoarchaeota archaeon]|nr:glycosyl transferase family 4 [Nanoarchaeota archaeon]